MALIVVSPIHWSARAQDQRDPIFTSGKITPDILLRHIIPRAKTLSGVRDVKILGPTNLQMIAADGRSVTIGLANLLDQLNSDSDASERSARIDETLKNMALMAAAQERGPALTHEKFAGALIPVIKNKAYLDEFRKIGGGAMRPLLHRPIAGDIIQVVGLDAESRTQILQQGVGASYGLSDEEMFDRAIKNLDAKITSLKMMAVGPVRIIDFDNNYNASLIVSDMVWSRLAEGKENDIVIAVPARDALAFAPASDKQAIAALRNIASMPNQAYPISTQLFRRQGKGWVAFK